MRQRPPLPTASSALVSLRPLVFFLLDAFKKWLSFPLLQRFLYFLGCSRNKRLEQLTKKSYILKQIRHHFFKLFWVCFNKLPRLLYINTLVSLSNRCH